jgi:hypothetical protein
MKTVLTPKQQAFVALDAFVSSRATLIKSMADAGYKTIEVVGPLVIEWVCAKTGAKDDGFTVSTVKSTGEVVTRLNRDHPKYEAHKTAYRRVMDIVRNDDLPKAPTSSAKKDPAALLAIAFGKLSAKEQQAFYALSGIDTLMA